MKVTFINEFISKDHLEMIGRSDTMYEDKKVLLLNGYTYHNDMFFYYIRKQFEDDIDIMSYRTFDLDEIAIARISLESPEYIKHPADSKIQEYRLTEKEKKKLNKIMRKKCYDDTFKFVYEGLVEYQNTSLIEDLSDEDYVENVIPQHYPEGIKISYVPRDFYKMKLKKLIPDYRLLPD